MRENTRNLPRSKMNTAESPKSNGSPRRSRSSRRKNRLSSALKDQSNVPVLSADYLFRHTSKNDLVRRLRKVVDALSDEDVECNSPEYPGLARLASDIVKDRYLKHKDKEVRLYTVLACMEIFRVYVPEPPYDESEILKIFPQLIQQLANLANCTSPTQPNFAQYFKLLEVLAKYKIGVVLVEMTKMLDPETEYGADMDEGHLHHSRDSPSSEEALEVLRELIEVLLNSIQIDHPSEVTALAIAAISACIEEFYGTVPIPILDEILKCIGAGPVVYVTNPAFVEASAALAASKKKGKKTEKKKLPPMQIQQTNQSYKVACGVIKKTIDRISTPTASLLNGLLNGDTNVMKFSNIAASEEPVPAEKGTIVAAAGCIPEKEQPTVDVWSIVYELHKISPHILTTVIGTVAASLQSPDEDKRLRVTKLLGRLFYSTTSDIGVNFHACYKEWTRRSMDMDVKIRETMVKCLLEILRNKSNCETLCEEASEVLVKMVTSDPSLDVRISSIHKVCDLAYSVNDGKDLKKHTKSMVTVPLLKAVGNRVSSKNKKERLDSVTGLAKIYHRHYILPKLKVVQDGGDDCNIDIILDTIHNNCDLGMYKVGKKGRRGKRKSVSSPMSHSPMSKESGYSELDEKYKFIAKKVFNSAFFTDLSDPIMRNRVVMIVDDVLLGTGTAALKDKSSSNKQILTPTSRAIGLSIIINHLLTNDESDEEHEANNDGTSYKWMCSLLVQRAKLQLALKSYIDLKSKAEKYPNGSVERNNMNAEAFEKLKHVASLSSPVNAIASPGMSVDSLDTILKKVHSARDKHIFRLLASISSPTHSMSARSRALEDLPKRTKSLGSSAASWIKCLARRCAMGHFVNVDTITHCILLAQEALNEKDLKVCMALLECVKVAVNVYPSLGSTEEGYETLIELFGECRGQKGEDLQNIKDCGILTTLSGILAAVTPARTSPRKNATKDSSPAFEDEFKSELYRLCTKDGTPEQAKNAIVTMAALVENQNFDQDSQRKEFEPLLKALTASSSMCLSVDGVDNAKVENVLITLTAMVESVPALFMATSEKDNGNKAVQFALNKVLQGESKNEDGIECDENNIETTPSRRKSKKRKDSQTLSLACRRAIAAIDFLVSHIRSTLLYARKSIQKPTESKRIPSDVHISTVFEVLVNIIRDGGYLSSCKNQHGKDIFRERSALRKCAAISLLKLCDGSLNIENKYFSSQYWHIFSRIFVDEDYDVRDAIMNELSTMLIGEGSYRQGNQGFLPSLRFLACITLCPDDDHQSYMCGARVGKRSMTTKNAAEQCVTSLRRTSEDTLLQCRAISKKAEMNFENNLKMKLMPEFAVPYAFHLLSFRPETPCGGFVKRKSSDMDLDRDEISKEELSHKLLRKRLRWLLEPLVQSLGDGADNISFLLRMTELLGHRYRPVDVLYSNTSNTSFPNSPFSDLSLGENDSKENDDLSQAKLKVICTEAREMLLKFVKKDKNLDPYPGAIQIPGFLYKRSKMTRSPADVPKPIDKDEDTTPTSNSTPGSISKRRRIEHSSGDKKSIDSANLSINLSPIPQSRSPQRLVSKTSVDKDFETKTPPSASKKKAAKKEQKALKSKAPAVGVRRSKRLSEN